MKGRLKMLEPESAKLYTGMLVPAVCVYTLAAT